MVTVGNPRHEVENRPKNGGEGEERTKFIFQQNSEVSQELYLSGLLRALLRYIPTTFLEIAVYKPYLPILTFASLLALFKHLYH